MVRYRHSVTSRLELALDGRLGASTGAADSWLVLIDLATRV
jgi:hypothetical protein